MKFFSFNQVLRWIALAITIVFLSGCAAANYDPAVPVGLLTKSRDFLFFCLCITQQSDKFFIQCASRYYYAMFSMAKVVSMWRRKEMTFSFLKQDSVWSVMPHSVKTVYGNDLKRVRVKSDYFPDVNNDKSTDIKLEIRDVINDTSTFCTLSDTVKEILPQYYLRAGEDGKILEQECYQLLEEIKDANNKLKDLLNQ